MRSLLLIAGFVSVSWFSCASRPKASSSEAQLHSREPRLAALRQLTFGGENAEAYWSSGGEELIFQSRRGGAECDRIYRMDAEGGKVEPVSSGEGATTCSYFLPGDEEVLYASTHLGGSACPPKPDRSQGYVWALYPSYDIFRARKDGSGVRRLTETPGYDAEATVCAKDGSVVFTSVRDGDLELYRMDADGKNVRRLTVTPGYDGGAFFNADCSKLVWRASRPAPGPELDEYQRLLAQGLVRPSKLELYVADADGSNPTQVTYLNAASFAPYFFPDGQRILFSSNAGDPKGREFDLWRVNVDGTGLERVTNTPGFDGFPMFSPDGRRLVFASNRATAPGAQDTNLFLAEWKEADPAGQGLTAADRVKADVRWLAAPEREGRGVGTEGLKAAGAWIESRMKALGLEPAAERGYRQPFSVNVGLDVKEGTAVSLGDKALAADAFRPLPVSASGAAQGRLVLAGYGIHAPDLGRDDYAGKNLKGAVALVRRFTPEGGKFEDGSARRRYGDLRHKAFEARRRGAVALLVVDSPERPKGAAVDWKAPDEARFLALEPRDASDIGLPAAMVSRAAAAETLKALEAGRPARASVDIRLQPQTAEAFNVVARIPAGAARRLPGFVVVGAHYDHLGLGGSDSLAPDVRAPHLGADDNASGVAGLLEVAKRLSEKRASLTRDVVLVAFSGEERGVLGSTHYVRGLEAGGRTSDVVAMLNMDMVGRLRGNRVSVLGADSAAEWAELVNPACQAARVECPLSGDGYGPSDQMPFYAAGIPVLHFFTGAHGDYHKPSDAPERINAAGLARIAEMVADVTGRAAQREARLTYKKVESPPPVGDMRGLGASLGTIPDYAGPPPGQAGVLLAGVRAGGPAEKAGLQRGDLLIRLGSFEL
ncbi:MAG TPA: M20/M25/M40 family metallo-hydrolase, partial [Myxococcaceae bacterium]|nr:M20/M25/M40 family metallo-hydrolase [Myxococcaceae bacterium]